MMRVLLMLVLATLALLQQNTCEPLPVPCRTCNLTKLCHHMPCKLMYGIQHCLCCCPQASQSSSTSRQSVSTGQRRQAQMVGMPPPALALHRQKQSQQAGSQVLPAPMPLQTQRAVRPSLQSRKRQKNRLLRRSVAHRFAWHLCAALTAVPFNNSRHTIAVRRSCGCAMHKRVAELSSWLTED